MGPVWTAVLFGVLGGLLAELGVLVRWALAAPRVIGTHLRRPGYYLVGSLWALGSGMLAAVVATGVSLDPLTSVVIGVSTSLVLQWFLSFRLRSTLPPATTTVRAADLERSPTSHRVRAWSFVWPSALVGATFIVLVCWVLARTLSSELALGIGIVLVVFLGAVGLVLRGIGDELDSLRLRALGYYLGALAYAATASVALYNGLPQLLQM
jgi:hypothetical protein